MTIPNCDPSDTILQVDLDKVKTSESVLKIKLVNTDEGSFLIFVLKSDPTRELFLTTRRDRTRPKVFVDQNLLLDDLRRSFPDFSFNTPELRGIVFEATRRQLTPPAPDAETANETTP